MANPAKKKGTQFESSCVNYLRAIAGVEVTREALHGNRDEGDLRMVAHGRRFACECKCVERVTPRTMAEFRLQTTVEAANAGAVGGILLQWRQGKGYRWDASPDGERAKSFGDNMAHMTVETLMQLTGATGELDIDAEVAQTWVTTTIKDLAIMAMEVPS